MQFLCMLEKPKHPFNQILSALLQHQQKTLVLLPPSFLTTEPDHMLEDFRSNITEKVFTIRLLQAKD